MPCIIRWPGKIKSGSICNELVTAMDLLPTIASICQSRMPVQKIDGLNMMDLLLERPAKHPRQEFAYYYDRNNLKAVRSASWKLVLPCISQTYGKPEAIGKDGYPGKYSTDSVTLALYNLATDPGEDRDLKDQYPEIVKELELIADRYRKEIGDGLTKQTGAEVRPAATVQ